MNSFFTQVSSSIRILGWNRDASARATHLKAAGGNVPSATIERKSMSTKTSIKRIALVAAAALTIGGFSAVSAHAASATTITQVIGTGDGGVGGVAGPANTLQVTITPDATLATTADYVTVTGGTIISSDSTSAVTIASTGLSATVSGTRTLTIATPSAGSLVINAYDATSASTYASTVSVTKTITINATAISGTYSAAKSSVYIAAGETTTPVTADAVINVASTAASVNDTNTTAAATIQVIYSDANGTPITNDSITATIVSGGGNLNGVGDSNTARSSFSSTAGLKNVLQQYSKSVTSLHGAATFVIWPNGQTGVSTVVIKNGAGTVLATKTLIFSSTTPASVSVKVMKPNVLNSTTPTAKVFAVNVYDSGSNEITSLGAGGVTAAVATGSTVGGTVVCLAYDPTDLVYYCSAAAASTAPTASDASETYTFTAGTVTTTATVKFVSGVLTTVSVAGPASADPGTKVSYTLTAMGANGSAMPDGDYSPGAIFTNADPSTNASLTAIPFGKGETITLAGGTATDYTYAPFSGALSASWTVAGTASTAATVSVTGNPITSFLGAGLAKALAATTVTADDVAVTANTDATAAANAATDAANAAADAADQATAAVTELQTQVVALIAAIQKQITALTVLITKIKNKVKA